MSRTSVGMVVETLLTDQNLRLRFALDRMETIAELCLRGFDLSRDEIELFCWTDAGVWFLGSAVKARRTSENRAGWCCEKERLDAD